MCAQRRTQKPSSALSYGTSGAAVLYKVSDTKARIEFDGGKDIDLEVVQGNIFENEKATLPTHVPFKLMKPQNDGGKPINVKVSMEEGDKRVLFIHPLSGTYKAKFIGFSANPKDEHVPAWTEKENKWNKIQRIANPYIVLTDKKQRWEGCSIRCRLIDKFGKDPDDGNTTIWEEEKGTYWKQLEDFCNAIGFEYWNEPYTENNLPKIQEVGRANGLEFEVVLSNGYVSTWIPALPDDTFEDEIDENFPKSDAEKLLEE